MKWRIVWTPRTQKDIDALDPITARRIHCVLERFSETGHEDLRRLVNITPEAWRIRIGNPPPSTECAQVGTSTHSPGAIRSIAETMPSTRSWMRGHDVESRTITDSRRLARFCW